MVIGAKNCPVVDGCGYWPRSAVIRIERCRIDDAAFKLRGEEQSRARLSLACRCDDIGNHDASQTMRYACEDTQNKFALDDKRADSLKSAKRCSTATYGRRLKRVLVQSVGDEPNVAAAARPLNGPSPFGIGVLYWPPCPEQ